MYIKPNPPSPPLPSLFFLTHLFRSAKPSRIDSFLKLISDFGILESTRTGLMALPRSPLHAANEEIEKDASDLVDVSSLPPG